MYIEQVVTDVDIETKDGWLEMRSHRFFLVNSNALAKTRLLEEEEALILSLHKNESLAHVHGEA